MRTLQELAREALDRDPGLPGVQFEGRWHSWGELQAAAAQAANLLEATGADARAPVLFIARNLPSSLAALVALVAAGRNVRMLYSFQAPAAMAREIGRLQPAVVIAPEESLGEEIQGALRAAGAAAIALRSVEPFALPGFERSASTATGPAEPTIEIQTSGTTGPPKHFPLSYEMAARHFVYEHPVYADVADAKDLPPFLLYSPLPNLSGMMSTLPALMLGHRMILLDRLDLGAWLDWVREYRPEYIGLQPALVQMILDADVPPEDLASIKMVVTGSAPLDPVAHRAFEEKYGATILLSYGATEFLGTIAAMTPQLRQAFGEAKFGSVGRAVAGVTIRIVDADTGEVLPSGEQGVLEVLAPKIRSDWIRTSDLGVLDEDGFVFLRGRADGAIMRGGFKLLPETIERALQAHPAVSVAAVAGVPDRRLGQVPAAAVQLKPGAEPPSVEELKAHLRQHVLATHIPVQWRFVEEVPRTQSLKVDRRALAALFEPAEPLAT